MKSADRQAQILRCAKQVFADRGYHGANISHICAAAGIGRGTLYQYFANKKAVFVSLLRQTLERIHRLMVERRPAQLPLPATLQRATVVAWSARRLKAILAAAFEDDQTLRITLREAVGLDVDIESILGEIDNSLIAVVAEDLRRAQRAGIVRDLDPELTATLMVGGVEKLALAALRSQEPVDLGVLARETAALHCTGLLSDAVSGR